MAIRIIPVLEDGMTGFGAEWKTLVQSFDALEELAHELDVLLLKHFDSTLPEDVAQEDESDEIRAQILEHDGVLPTRRWFQADDDREQPGLGFFI